MAHADRSVKIVLSDDTVVGPGNGLPTTGGGGGGGSDVQYAEGATAVTATGTLALWKSGTTLTAASTATPFPVSVVSGGGGGTPDDSTYTAGSSTFSPVGGVFDDSIADATTGKADGLRITAKRGLHVNLRNASGTEISPATETTLSALNTKIPASPATDRATAGAPASVRLSDGSAFYVGTKTGQLPTALTGSGNLSTAVAEALPTGANTIGKVDQGAGGASAWKVDGSAVTQPVSASSLPLPTGAATETTLAALNTKIPASPATDRATAAAPFSTRLSDGAAFYKATTPSDTQPISAASLPLPTGAATETTLAALNTKIPASPATDRSTAAAPFSVRLSTGAAFYDGTKTGQLPTALSGSGNLSTAVAEALPTGANVIGGVTQSGTWNVGISTGSNTVGKVDQGTGGASAWKVDGSAVTQPISASALPLPTGAATETTLAALNTKIPASPATDRATAAAPFSVRLSDGSAFYDGAKTGQLPSALVSGRLDVNIGAASATVTVAGSGTFTVAGAKTNNNAAPGATNVGVLGALANAAVPTWTEGNQVALSSDLAGSLRTLITSSVTTTDRTATGAIANNGDTVSLTPMPGCGTVGIQITGTMVATLQFEKEIESGQWVTLMVVTPGSGILVSSTTTTGTFYAAGGGILGIRVRCSAFTSGPAQVSLIAGSGSAVTRISSPLPAGTNTIGGMLGTKTNNNAAPGATNVGALGCIANAADPSWTEGNQVASSVDLSGYQRMFGKIQGTVANGASVPSNPVSIGFTGASGLLRNWTGVNSENNTAGLNTPAVGPVVWDGTTNYNRLLSGNGADNSGGAGIAAAGNVFWDGSVWRRGSSNATGQQILAGTYAEDAAGADGDRGFFNLMRRTDTPGTLVGTTGDYAALQGDANDSLRVVADGYNRVAVATLTRPANTTAYAAGDEMTDTGAAILQFSACALVNGGGGIVTGLLISSSVNAATKPVGELRLYDTTSTPATDNAAFDSSDGVNDTAQVVIPFGLGSDGLTGTTGNSLYDIDGLSKTFKCAAADTKLYGRIILKAAYTSPANSDTFKFTLRMG